MAFGAQQQESRIIINQHQLAFIDNQPQKSTYQPADVKNHLLFWKEKLDSFKNHHHDCDQEEVEEECYSHHLNMNQDMVHLPIQLQRVSWHY